MKRARTGKTQEGLITRSSIWAYMSMQSCRLGHGGRGRIGGVGSGERCGFEVLRC
jgi:hypothetical protein